MVVFLLFGRDGVISRDGMTAVYGTVEKSVNSSPSGDGSDRGAFCPRSGGPSHILVFSTS